MKCFSQKVWLGLVSIANSSILFYLLHNFTHTNKYNYMCVCTLLSDYVVAVFVACGILFSALTLQWPTAVQFYDSSILIDHLLCISPFVGGGSAGYILVPSSLCSHLVLLSAPGVLDIYWQVSIILSTLTLLSTFFVGIRRPSSNPFVSYWKLRPVPI